MIRVRIKVAIPDNFLYETPGKVFYRIIIISLYPKSPSFLNAYLHDLVTSSKCLPNFYINLAFKSLIYLLVGDNSTSS